MPRPLMYQQRPWEPVLITMRCVQSRYLLRPSPACNRRLLGVLGRAMELCAGRMHLYFGGGTSNHLHLAAAFESAEDKARFKAHFKANVSREIGDLHDWPGAMWEGRGRDIHVLDDEALHDQLVYLAAHAVKEGLSRVPADWPGIGWVGAVTGGAPLVGVWYDRSELYRRRRAWRARRPAERGPWPVLHDVAREITIELTPPPMWAHLDTDALQARWRELVDTALERHPPTPAPLGAEAVCAADPHTRPARTKKTPAPRVHTRQPALRRAWRAAYVAFVASYRAAMHALRSGASSCCFPPEGCRPVCLTHGGG